MHGRIKTITSAEQKIKQMEARAKKQEQFSTDIEVILKRKHSGNYGDETLPLLEQLLVSNPNIITLWNYRREILLKKNLSLDRSLWNDILHCELTVTEHCLRSDPKSYGTWHHRLWALENLPDSVWKKELNLCNKMLSMDERNFHCWDYRKIITERSNASMLDEYAFTTAKIESNFSNYSAWHFRSKLLPKLFPDPAKKYPVEESKHREELELVQNAAFTDPDDQSAWFYQRWLLNLRNTSLSFAWAFITDAELYIAFSQSVPFTYVHSLIFSNRNQVVKGKWYPCSQQQSSSVWKFAFSMKLAVDDCPEVVTVVGDEEIRIQYNLTVKKEPAFVLHNSPDLKETLKQQLISCEELLELEPDSKWTLLTSIFIMKALNLQQFGPQILSRLEKLAQGDNLRKGYYTDLASKTAMELELLKIPYSQDFSLRHSNLHSLYHIQYLGLTNLIDLSGNHLSNDDLRKLYPLVNCTTLRLDQNLLTSIIALPHLKKLVTLSFKSNPITNPDQDRDYLKNFSSLKDITYSNDINE